MSYNKFYLYKKQVSYDNGVTWEDVIPLEQVPSGESIGTYETLEECEAIPFLGKFKATYSNGRTYSAECTSQDETLTRATTRPSGYQHSAMTSAEIGDCVTSIGTYAFQNCSSLQSIDIPSGVTSIGIGTFNGCTSLTSIEIPSGVTSIGMSAFQGCRSLTSITCNATTPPILGSRAFDNTNNCPIYVPCQSLEAYKTAWSAYESRIQCVPPVFGGKFKAIYSDGQTYSAECDSSTVLTSATTKPSGYEYSAMTTAEIGDCATSIGDRAFYKCSNLTGVTIPNSVTSIGDYAFCQCSSIPSIDIPDSVTSIGWMAFFNCRSLPSVTIPNSVTSIDYYAFERCTSLTSVTIPDSVTSIGGCAFQDCSSLTRIICNAITPPRLVDANVFLGTNNCPIYIPCQSLEAYKTAWSAYADRIQCLVQYRWVNLDPAVDYYCSGTTKYYKQQKQVSYTGGTWQDVVPAEYQWGVTAETQSTDCGYVPPVQYRWVNLDPAVDYYCSGITKHYKQQKRVSYDGGTTWQDVVPAEYQWGIIAETKSTDCGYVPPTGLKFFATYKDGRTYSAACDGNTELASATTQPSGYEYTAMTSAEIENCVTSIGEYAFSRIQTASVMESFRSLTSVTIPSSVTSIGDYAFYYCTSLTSLNIPHGVTSIGDFAIYYCSGLTSVTIPDSVVSIGRQAFHSCESLTSITIPNSVTSIGGGAFFWCTRLTSINIPSGVTSIGGGTFNFCHSLTSITIPDSVTSIGQYAFHECSGLTSVTIGNSVTSIDSYAFWSCTSLESITIKAITPPALGRWQVFDNTNYCPIYVPAVSVDAYKTAWSRYADRIQAIP